MQHADYRRTGAIFFPDFWELDFTHPLWSVVGHGVGGGGGRNSVGKGESVEDSERGVDSGSHQAELQQESGIVLVDRWRHWGALLLLCYMNGDGQAEWYATLCDGGEKETYHSAWRWVLSVELGWVGGCWLLAADQCTVYGIACYHRRFNSPVIFSTAHPPQIHQLDLPHDFHLPGLNLGANFAIKPPNLLWQDHVAARTRWFTVRPARDTR